MSQRITTKLNFRQVGIPEWVYYYCIVEGLPAIVSVDMCLGPKAPLTKFPYLFHLSLPYSEKNAEGFPGTNSLSALSRIEEKLVSRLEKRSDLFAGKVTSNGRRDFLVYTGNPSLLTEKAEAIMRSFPNSKFQIKAKPDIDWDFYFDFLFPSEKELNTIFNQRMISRLEASKRIVHQKNHLLEHRFYFKSEENRDKFIVQAIDEYFNIEEIGLSGDHLQNPWLLRISRQESVELPYLNTLTMHLIRSAADLSGIYDGWSIASKR